MKTGLIILCRYDSSRLPGKILKKIEGKEILSYIYERLLLVQQAHQIVLATSIESSDDPIVHFGNALGIACYRGSKDNVAQRFLDCATYFGFDYAVRVNGDNILLDAHIIDELIQKAEQQAYDFVSNVKNRTFPEGISVEVVKTSFYQKALALFNEPRYLEHVTLYFYEHEIGKYHFHYRLKKEETLPKLALDTETDFQFISQLITKMQKPHTHYFLEDILEFANQRNNC